jgi:Domain of unknown function (DUF222)
MTPRIARHDFDAFAGVGGTLAEREFAAAIFAADRATDALSWAALTPTQQRECQLSGADRGCEDWSEAAEDDASAAACSAVTSDYLTELAAGTLTHVTPVELTQVAAMDPAAHRDRCVDGVAQLAVITRLKAWLASREYDVIATLCPPDLPDCSHAGSGEPATTPSSWLAEQHLAEEIGIACRVASGTAHSRIATARALTTVFAAAGAALAAGTTSEAHVRALVSGTANIVDDQAPTQPEDLPTRTRDDKRAAVQDQVLDRAKRETPGKFRTTVAAAVCAVDAAGEADRRANATATRDVWVSEDQDGLGVLIDRDQTTRLTAIHTELSRRARLLQRQRGGAKAARGGDPDARIGACRADALAAAILGTGPGPSTAEPREPALEAHLVIDLPTLRGLADNPCSLDGVPIPAPVGRELARTVKAWRRMVVHPVTGHLLDYGRRTYLPQPLTDYITARDGVCTVPYCERKATRCQVDHRMPFPQGPSNTENTGLLCDRHHPLKTAGLARISDSRSDGAMTWTTPWGQTVRAGPHPYLDNPAPDHPDSSEPDPGDPGLDPPPF